LSFVVGQPTFGIYFKLLPKVIDVYNAVAGQPLPSCTVFDESNFAGNNLFAFSFKSLLWVEMFDNPQSVGTQIARN
jgi:hypothetical protein